MKPKNSPGRKLARRLAADIRAHSHDSASRMTAERVRDETEGGSMGVARAVRTKKRRASV